MARLEVQKFRYLQDINNLKYFERHTDQWRNIQDKDKQILVEYFECKPKITMRNLKTLLGLDNLTKLNLEAKNLKGNITACEIRSILNEQWDNYSEDSQYALVEDLLSIKKKSALKTRLIKYWKLDKSKAIKLCLVEFEPGHSKLSLKAINNLLPFLKQGLIYSKKDRESDELGALQAAGYEDEFEEFEQPEMFSKLPKPIETSNPIVNKGLHELRRVVNAIIKQYGKPDVIRIEMARDLEMNTKKYEDNKKARQAKNKKENEEAVDAFRKLNLGQYPSRNDRIKYRLWEEQKRCCAYSNKIIPLNTVFTAQVEIDHILPYKKSLDDSYMNKVLCFTIENRAKGDRTPKDAWGGNNEKWTQITQAISLWKDMDSKVKRFYQTGTDLQERDFISSQLNDTRYIAKLALDYVKYLGCDVFVTKGYVVSQIRHQWGFNDLLGEINKKDRTDHRHHAIDAVVIAATSRQLYKKAVNQIKNNKLKVDPPYLEIRKELTKQLDDTVVSHVSQRKLSGGLHKETGAGYIERHGGLVYRKTLMPSFTVKNANSIVDETVKSLVLAHIEKYGDDPKKAFADGVKLYHKDSKTVIKRVRVLQSKTTEKKLEQSKFGVKDKSGKVFKYMSYGNIHHVEILKHKETGKYKSDFITMMQASHRAKGIRSTLNPEGYKQMIVRMDHGEALEFIMALHINDLVSIDKEGKKKFYRVQKPDSPNSLKLRLNTAATISNKNEEMLVSIPVLMSLGVMKHNINAIGIITND